MKNFYQVQVIFLLFVAGNLQSQSIQIRWNRRSNLPTPRWLGAAVICDDRIYVIGGRGPEDRKIYKYNPATDLWVTEATLPDYQVHAAVGVIRGQIYVVGGAPDGKNERFDPLTKQWQTLEPLPTPRYHNSSCVLNDKLHVIGGSYGRYQPAKEHEVYDPSTNTWQQKAPGPGGGAVVADKIFSIGGEDGHESSVAKVEMYDSKADVWIEKHSLPLPMLVMGIAVVRDKIFALGGQMQENGGEEKVTSAIFVYETSTDSWSNCGNLPEKIQFPQVVVFQEKIFVIGGCDPQYNPISTVWCSEVIFSKSNYRPYPKK